MYGLIVETFFLLTGDTTMRPLDMKHLFPDAKSCQMFAQREGWSRDEERVAVSRYICTRTQDI